MSDVIPAACDRRPLRVAVGDLAPAPMLGYVDQVIGASPAEIDFTFFLGSYRYPDVDVVHFHDVDGFLGGRTKTPKERVAAATSIVDHAQKNGVAMVRTVLGSSGPQGDPALDILDQVTSRFIVLEDATPTPEAERTTLIPPAHHRGRFLGYPHGEQVRGRLLCIARAGIGRAAEGPLRVFSVTDTPGLNLRIVGAAEPALEPLLQRAVARNRGTVSTRTETISDAETVREIDAAEMVILPEIQSLTDVTLLFTALSRDRPVLLPDSGAARALSESIGGEWIFRHEGPITAETLDAKVAELRYAMRSPCPHLEGRDLDATAAKYAGVYRAVVDQIMSRSS